MKACNRSAVKRAHPRVSCSWLPMHSPFDPTSWVTHSHHAPAASRPQCARLHGVPACLSVIRLPPSVSDCLPVCQITPEVWQTAPRCVRVCNVSLCTVSFVLSNVSGRTQFIRVHNASVCTTFALVPNLSDCIVSTLVPIYPL